MLLNGIGLAGIIYGVYEFPVKNETFDKKVWEEFYPAKPHEIIFASGMIVSVGLGLIYSYKEKKQKEERNYFYENDEFTPKKNEEQKNSLSYYFLDE